MRTTVAHLWRLSKLFRVDEDALAQSTMRHTHQLTQHALLGARRPGTARVQPPPLRAPWPGAPLQPGVGRGAPGLIPMSSTACRCSSSAAAEPGSGEHAAPEADAAPTADTAAAAAAEPCGDAPEAPAGAAAEEQVSPAAADFGPLPDALPAAWMAFLSRLHDRGYFAESGSVVPK